MTIFYILLNICFPYHNVIIPVYTKINGCISTFCSTITTSSPTNLVCGFISRCCILDIFSSSVRKTSTFSCSWIPFGYFSSWPPPLRSCGIFGYICSSWAAPFLRSLWFFNLYFLLLNYPIGFYFYLFI